MTKKQIVQSLRHLHRLRIAGDPDQEWVQSTRASLLARVSEESRVEKERVAPVSIASYLTFFKTAFPVRVSSLVYRPVLASIISVFVIMGSGVGMVSASRNTIPGDALYPVKIASERTQIAFTPSKVKKTELKVAFVGRRVQEVEKIARREPAERAKHVDTVVSKMKNDLGDIQEDLQRAATEEEPRTAAAIAKLVDDQSEEFSKTLEKAGGSLSQTEQAPIREAQVLVRDVSVKAVAVLVQAHEDGAAEVDIDDLVSTLDEKIDKLATGASAVTSLSTSTPSQSSIETASQGILALGEAKALLEQSDLASAYSKVLEGKELIEAAEKIVNAQNGTTLMQVLGATSTIIGPTIVSPDATFTLDPTLNGQSTSSEPEPQALPDTSQPSSEGTSTDAPAGG